MAVDLADLVDSLKREVSMPGAEETTFPDASDDSWEGNLQDSFWDCRLDGLLEEFTQTDGIVTPIAAGGDDMGRDLQQLVVFYAGIRIVRNQLRAMDLSFSAKAGPVQYETTKNGPLLVALLKELQDKRNIVLARLSDLGVVPTYYIDSICARNEALIYQDIRWASGESSWARAVDW